MARIRGEMEDRFGPLPEQGDHLFLLASVRMLAQRLRVRSIDYKDGALQVKFEPDSPVDPERLVQLLGTTPEAALTGAGVLRLQHQGSSTDRLEAAADLLKGLE